MTSLLLAVALAVAMTAVVSGAPSGARWVDPVRFMQLFPEFREASWDGWREVLRQLTPETREFYVIAGRGCGKSRITAMLAALAASKEYRRGPGEAIYVGVFAPDRKQARVTFRYVHGLLRSVPALAALIVSETRESIELSNGVVIEVITASKAAPRGRAYAVVVVEEAAFLPANDSANPDVELLRAVRPALARVRGSLLVVVSSPYARRGALYEAWKRYTEHPDPSVLLVRKPTLELNPTFDGAAIAKAFEDDPVSAASEYSAEFRSDVESYVTPEAVDAVTGERPELPPVAGVQYDAGFDGAGGSGQDEQTMAIGHTDGSGRRVLDVVRGVRPPFSPERVIVEDFTPLLKRYGITRVVADRWGGEWPRECFAKANITYVVCEYSKSELYSMLLPKINSGRVELRDVPKLRAQLLGLERRVARGGKDSIDHRPGAHDDLINAAAIVLAPTVTPAFNTAAAPVGIERLGGSRWNFGTGTSGNPVLSDGEGLGRGV